MRSQQLKKQKNNYGVTLIFVQFDFFSGRYENEVIEWTNKIVSEERLYGFVIVFWDFWRRLFIVDVLATFLITQFMRFSQQ